MQILVTYASYFGSTADVAAALGTALRDQGHRVDVIAINDQPTLATYDAVVVGSAVQRGEWLPLALDFLRDNQAALQHLPVAVFCVHIANLQKNKHSQQLRLAYLNQVREWVQPVDEAFFAGRFDRRGAALLLPRWAAWLVPPMDFRNWKKIEQWGQSLATTFSMAQPALAVEPQGVLSPS